MNGLNWGTRPNSRPRGTRMCSLLEVRSLRMHSVKTRSWWMGGPQPQDWHPSRREQDPQRHWQGEEAAHGGRAEMGGRGLPAKAQPPDAVRGLDRVSLRGRRRNPPTCSHLILDPGPLQNREKINFCCFKPPRVWHFVVAPPGDPYMAARC